MVRLTCLLALFLLLASVPAAGLADEGAAPEPGKPDPELQQAIDQAIDRGAAWLRDEQKDSGGFVGLTVKQKAQVHHELGTTALAGLALLAAGGKRGDPYVDRIYEYLKEKDNLFGGAGGRSTYDTGILLMFITAYWRGEVEEEEEPRGHTRPAGGRTASDCHLPKDVIRWVQDLVNWLVRVRKTAFSTWGYPAHRDDHSNTQYAFLGLRAARDCGAKVPAPVFVQAAMTLLDRQEEDGPKMPRILPNPDPKASPYVIDCGDRARGWSYLTEPFVATGSMTTSGIAILAICHDALTSPARKPLYTGRMEQNVTQAIQDGFCWLAKNWSVTRNPPNGVDNWHFYYLYGLERASVFGGRDLIGEHDWYIEGARHLISKQHGDGRWRTGFMGTSAYEGSDIVDTAWAILFLARATRPMPPIRAPVVTPGD